jgi:dTDP-4-dehydrorhamnose reductase
LIQFENAAIVLERSNPNSGARLKTRGIGLKTMAKIAVTGSNGFVGGNIANILLAAGHEVIGLVRSQPEKPLPWKTTITDLSSTTSIVEATKGCTAIVHSGIANDFNKLQQNREYAYDSFVGLTQRVTHAANKNGAQIVYISTGWVMDGAGHMALESDTGNPVNFYGVLKSLGEQVIRDLAPDTGVIARVDGVMGIHQTLEVGPRTQDVGFGYFASALVADLKAGKTFTVFGGDLVNKVTAPSLASEIGAQVERIIARKVHGTFHLVGDDAITRMDYARLICEIFELDKTLLREAAPTIEDQFPGQVPVDTSLSNLATKKALGIGPTSLRDLLIALKTEIDTGKITAITKPEVLV